MLNATSAVPQPMRPHGIQGRIFGALMERLNRPAYRLAAGLISLPPGGAFLEIGFGTGRLMEMLAERDGTVFLAGVDASPLMVATATRRLDRRHMTRDLREGNAERLAWGEDEFDAAAALHCFQFWSDPVSVLNEVHRTLKPGGHFVMVLRRHEGRETEWLPNPWSRMGDETGSAATLMEKAGFDVEYGIERGNDNGHSPVLIGRC
ncbi:MAG: class I SAM-dependent methyltransferase [Parvibaculum sp.]|uniref:class I SAM-dependent methyltransferase n=1 Tax=Parvibaculum sp. TaxID=2024848 RepID=UPI0025DAEEFD|nr:class I SAM-dependent methyltransferase [Parvibaculum sp.]MCE9648404.1 class I SAM-dependent methyltransferase [Parvibaculum sp.]